MVASEKSHKNYQTASNFYLKTDLKLMKNSFLSVKKIKKSGNCIYDCARSFFGEDIYPICYTCEKVTCGGVTQW